MGRLTVGRRRTMEQLILCVRSCASRLSITTSAHCAGVALRRLRARCTSAHKDVLRSSRIAIRLITATGLAGATSSQTSGARWSLLR